MTIALNVRMQLMHQHIKLNDYSKYLRCSTRFLLSASEASQAVNRTHGAVQAPRTTDGEVRAAASAHAGHTASSFGLSGANAGRQEDRRPNGAKR